MKKIKYREDEKCRRSLLTENHNQVTSVENYTEGVQHNTLEDSQANLKSLTVSTMNFTESSKDPESTQFSHSEDEGIILHVMDSDLELFPCADTEIKKI